MDEPPKKRPFWQLHLSTAVSALLLVSLFLLINLRVAWIEDNYLYRILGGSGANHIIAKNRCGYINKLGWPFTFIRAFTGDQKLSAEQIPGWQIREFSAWGLTGNIVAGLLLLVVFSVVCEWLIRQREARKS